MARIGIINWSPKKFDSIKRDLLFFDRLYFLEDEFQFHKAMTTAKYRSGRIKNPKHYFNELDSTIKFLKSKKVLESIDEQLFIQEHSKDSNNNFQQSIYYDNYQSYLDIVKKESANFKESLRPFFRNIRITQDYNKIDFNLLRDHDYADITNFISMRALSSKMNLIQSKDTFIPIIDGPLISNNSSNNKVEIIKLVLKNIPVPSSIIPFDEILDFRKDKDNNRRYMGLTNWINDIAKASLNISELQEKLEYMTTEFEAYMQTQKYEYELNDLEVILKLPLEIIKQIYSGEWGKLVNTILNIKKDKMKLLASEMTAPSKEIAYIIKANEKFGSN